MINHEMTVEEVEEYIFDNDLDDMTYHEAVKELFFCQEYSASATNFSSYIYMLFGKADNRNRPRLARGFPMCYYVWLLWSHNDIDWIEKEFARLHCV